MKNYFKKFSIMFVMLLAVMGIDIIQNGTVANAASRPITWNINDKAPGINLSSDLLTSTCSTLGGGCVRATQGKSSGKWYWEVKVLNGNGSIGENEIGVGGLLVPLNNFGFGDSASGYSYYDFGNIHNGKGYGYGQQVAKYGVGDIIGIALNLDDNNGELTFFKNGAQQGTKYTNIKAAINGDIYPMVGHYRAPNSAVVNFGLTPFRYSIPTGYSAYDQGSNILLEKNISLNKVANTLQVGQTDNLMATTTPAGAELVWSSSDTGVAAVDSTGKVTAVKEGQATITAQIKGSDVKATCIVNVTNKIVQPNPNDPGTDETSKIVNIAHAKGDNTNNAGGDVSIIFKGVAEAQLNVVKTADVDSVYVGDTFTYTIVITNTSSKTAKAVVMNDSTPNHIDFLTSGVTTTQGNVDPSSTSKNIIVNVGDIPPSGTVTIKIPATVIL